MRKGKAPRPILENYVGRERLIDESLDEVLPQACAEAIREEKLQNFGTPGVEVLQNEPLIFKAKVPLALRDFERLSKATPHLCSMNPAGKWYMEDLHYAGGIPAVILHGGPGVLVCCGADMRLFFENTADAAKDSIRCWLASDDKGSPLGSKNETLLRSTLRLSATECVTEVQPQGASRFEHARQFARHEPQLVNIVVDVRL